MDSESTDSQHQSLRTIQPCPHKLHCNDGHRKTNVVAWKRDIGHRIRQSNGQLGSWFLTNKKFVIKDNKTETELNSILPKHMKATTTEIRTEAIAAWRAWKKKADAIDEANPSIFAYIRLQISEDSWKEIEGDSTFKSKCGTGVDWIALIKIAMRTHLNPYGTLMSPDQKEEY